MEDIQDIQLDMLPWLSGRKQLYGAGPRHEVGSTYTITRTRIQSQT